MQDINDYSTIKEVKSFLSANYEKGVVCPCCKQYVKRYRRSINSSMAYWLIWLVKSHILQNNNWIDVRNSPVRGGDYAKLQHWQLIEKKPNEDGDRRSSGKWRPTFSGIDFAFRRIKIYSHAILYNNEMRALEGDLIDISEALGNKYNYETLMNGFQFSKKITT